MSLETKSFEFGEFCLDSGEKVLLRNGKPVSLTPKTIHLLFVLVESHGRIVGKEDLMSTVWSGSFVEDSNLTYTVSLLRKALGNDKAGEQFIETVPKRGYRFVAPVREIVSTEVHQNGHRSTSPDDFDVVQSGQPSLIGDLEDRTSAVAMQSSKPHAIAGARPILFSLVAVLTGGFLLTGFFLFRNQPTYYQRFAANGSRLLTAEKLTNTGDASGIDISTDGKFYVYITEENGKDTIWLRLAASGKTVPVYSAVDESINNTSFSNDGEYIYFTHHHSSEPLQLSRISALGGPPTLILTGVHNGASFSPDDKQIAFMRLENQASRLMIADADGKNEHEILPIPQTRHLHSIGWSPDGKSISYCADVKVDGRTMFGIFGFDLDTMQEQPLTDLKWAWLEKATWLPDKSGMLLTASDKPEGSTQIWRLSLPDGLTEPITNNPSSISMRGATADFSKILAVQNGMVSNVWIAPQDNPTAVSQIAKAEFELAFAPDGKIVYQVKDAVSPNLWITSGDGGGKTQLTISDAAARAPAVSRDGKFIAYAAITDGKQNIWRMGADGREQTQLTTEGGANYPTFTADGRNIIYDSNKDHSLWQIPVEGGVPRQLSGEKHRRVSISPDGTKIAHIEFVNGKPKLLIESFPDCTPIRQYDAKIDTPLLTRIIWSKDGRSVTYSNNDLKSVGNLWQQSLSGGEPRQITEFTSERIIDFDTSADGTQVAYIRSTLYFDAVLLTGFR